MSDLYFNAESEENIIYNEDFWFTIPQPFLFDPEQKKTYGDESHEKERNILLHTIHIRIQNLQWCKCSHSKNEVREIDCFCYRKVGAMHIALAKVLEHKGRFLSLSFYEQLSDY